MKALAEIPYGAYWSTPFCKWQGSFANYHTIEFAAAVAKAELASKSIDPERIAFGVLGMTVPQHKMFWGVPWLMKTIGAPHGYGPTISQACATGTRCISTAVAELITGQAEVGLVVTGDRVSNGPHLYYPADGTIKGTGRSEDWVVDNIFEGDPSADQSMIMTAENVAAEWSISTEEQHEVVLRRFEQYQQATENNHSFQRRYMSLPFEIPAEIVGRAKPEVILADEGIHPIDAAKLDRLKTTVPGGTVTVGGQTHPADGNAGMLVVTPGGADEFSANKNIRVEILSFGSARGKAAHMPASPIEATHMALKNANLKITQMDAIKSHNPFAVNDLAFAKAMNIDVMKMNNFGCSLIYGHPQAPTATRQIIELIEELAILGGGYGLFQGCAAGDTGMAVILKVSD